MLVPTGRAPHKEIADDPGSTTRLELTKVAALENGLLEVSDYECVTAAGDDEPSYTVRTLEHLSERSDELHLLMGADVAAHLDEWHQPERVVELARLGIASRPGTAIDEAEATLDRLGAATGRRSCGCLSWASRRRGSAGASRRGGRFATS